MLVWPVLPNRCLCMSSPFFTHHHRSWYLSTAASSDSETRGKSRCPPVCCCSPSFFPWFELVWSFVDLIQLLLIHLSTHGQFQPGSYLSYHPFALRLFLQSQLLLTCMHASVGGFA